MKAECDVYEYAERTIKLSFDILETLEETKRDKELIQQESQELGEQGKGYVGALEKYANMWRDRYMLIAFNNEYVPIFYLANPDVYLEPVDAEHKTNWLKYRKYEYYKRHKQIVDKYGSPDEDMLISEEEALAIEYYLNKKHIERKQQIEEYKKEAYGKGRTRTLSRSDR